MLNRKIFWILYRKIGKYTWKWCKRGSIIVIKSNYEYWILKLTDEDSLFSMYIIVMNNLSYTMHCKFKLQRASEPYLLIKPLNSCLSHKQLVSYFIAAQFWKRRNILTLCYVSSIIFDSIIFFPLKNMKKLSWFIVTPLC